MPPPTGNGTYAYCVCCAETEAKLNKLSEGEREPVAYEGKDKKHIFTLAERVFFGVMKEAPPQTDPSWKNLETFKLLFGDVVLKSGKEDGAAGGGGDDESEEPYLHYAYQMPKASPERIVAMYKNRCFHSPGGKVLSNLGESGDDCGLQEDKRFLVKKGICPSVMEILRNWKSILGQSGGNSSAATANSDSTDIETLWMEATVGHPLNGRDIKEFLSLNGDPSSELEEDEKEIAARVLELWCEASAVAATARFYTRYKATVIDHVTLSRALTPAEKAEFMALVARYGEYLALLEVDVNSKMSATAALTGSSILYDRITAANAGSARAASENATTQAQTNHGTGWGTTGAPYLAGGGGGGAKREVTDFGTDLGTDAQKKFNALEANRSLLDPVERSLRNLSPR